MARRNARVDPVDVEVELEQAGPRGPAPERPARGDRVGEDTLVEVGPSAFVVVAAGDRVPAEIAGLPRHEGLDPPGPPEIV